MSKSTKINFFNKNRLHYKSDKKSPTKLIKNVNFTFFLLIKVNFIENLQFLYLKISVFPIQKST